MTQYFKFFIINLLFISINYLSVNGTKNESKFIATNEWQTVKKGNLFLLTV